MENKKRGRSPSPAMDARRPPALRLLDVTDHLQCSICMALYHDPYVLAASGQTYDLDCLLDYLGQGHSTCPMSRADLKDNPYATPNVGFRSMVADYIKKNPGAGELTPRQSFEPIHLLDPKIRKQAELKSLVKRLQEAVEVGVQVEVMNKMNNRIVLDTEAAQMLGAIPDALLLIVRFLSSESEDCRYYSASALANIAIVAECSPLIARTPDALIKLKSLLVSSEPDRVRTAAARSIGNVAVDEEARRIVLDVPGIFVSIAQCLSSEVGNLFEYSVYALGNLARDHDIKFAILRIQGVLPNLVRGMRHGDVGVRQYSSRALCNLAEHARNKEMIANYPDVLTLLVQCLRDVGKWVRWNASGALANLATDHDSIRTTIAAIPDALPLLIQLDGNDTNENVLRDAKRALANLSRNPEIKRKIEQLKEQQQQ